MPRASHKPPSQRQLRVGEVLRQALAEIFMRGEVYDPRLESAFITVSEVRASPDLRDATAYIMPLGGANAEETLEALAENDEYIRRTLARKVVLRYLPRLNFKLDRSYEHAGRVNQILHRPEVAADLAEDVLEGEEE